MGKTNRNETIKVLGNACGGIEVAGTTQVTIELSMAGGFAIQTRVTDNTPCAVNILDECINVCDEKLTIACHGFAEGLVGQASVCIGCAAAVPAACIAVACCVATFTLACHGLTSGERGQFTTTCADLPAGVCLCTNYFAISVTACTFRVAATRALALSGCSIAITDAGTGTHTLTPNGALPSGLCTCTNYFVIVDDDCTIRLASSKANAIACPAVPVDITALNAPAATIFTPTDPGAACAANGTITYHSSVDRENYATGSVITAKNLGNCAISDVDSVADAYYNEVQVDIEVLEGQYTVEIDVSKKGL